VLIGSDTGGDIGVGVGSDIRVGLSCTERSRKEARKAGSFGEKLIPHSTPRGIISLELMLVLHSAQRGMRFSRVAFPPFFLDTICPQ